MKDVLGYVYLTRQLAEGEYDVDRRLGSVQAKP